MSYPEIQREYPKYLEDWPDQVLYDLMVIVRTLEDGGSKMEMLDGDNENGFIHRLKNEVNRRMEADTYNVQS